MDSAPLTEKDQNLLTSIGATLLIVQAAERMLGQSLYRIFGLPELVTVQDLERLDSEARRATLGYAHRAGFRWSGLVDGDGTP